jgi:hypothetical protein
MDFIGVEWPETSPGERATTVTNQTAFANATKVIDTKAAEAMVM